MPDDFGEPKLSDLLSDVDAGERVERDPQRYRYWKQGEATPPRADAKGRAR
jgi:hypothetical protein